MLAFLLICTFIYGVAIAAVMYWLLQTLVRQMPERRLLKSLLSVTGPFLGSGGILLATFKAFDLSKETGVNHGNGLAWLSSLAGFGIVAIYSWWRSRPGDGSLFSDFSAQEDLHVLLLVNQYSRSLDEVADFLRISHPEAKRRNLAALRKIAG